MHPASAKGLMPTSECPKSGTISAALALRGKSYGINVLGWACTVASSATAMSYLDGPSIGSPDALASFGLMKAPVQPESHIALGTFVTFKSFSILPT